MSDEQFFYPAKRRAVIFHLISLSILLAGGILGLTQAAHSTAGFPFMLNLSVALVSVALLLSVAYRFYALWTGSYSLERDGVHLRWGLRSEDIPIDAVLWVRAEDSLGVRLPLPFFRWYGAVVGVRRMHSVDGSGGLIEYLSVRAHHLILIATPHKVYAISPADPEAFLAAFQRFREMGSLAPIQAQSVQPGFLFPEVWRSAPARALISGGIVLVVFLLVWVSIIISGRQQISLRLNPGNLATDYVPAVQLMLLPVMNAVFFFLDVSLGLFFYRNPAIRSLAYLLWGSSIIVSLLFIGAVYFISRAA